jgi:two-component system cell cycle sensor histidine kinase PleC
MSLEEAWALIERTLAANARARGVELRVQDPMPNVKVTADLNAVSQILINLVSNTIKFTPAGGAIEVGMESGESAGAGGKVDGAQRSANAIFVRDNGRGIPADKVAEVLKPFVQVSDAHTRDTGGVGLGRAICNSLATAMAGRIEIESALGRGTTVRVFLPMAGEQ